MRWTEPKIGETRTRRIFLLFPCELDGEWRWLEWVTVKEEYTYTIDSKGIPRWTIIEWS